MLKIGVVLGSVREERNGKAVADWTMSYAEGRKDEEVSYELVDLADYKLPLLGITPTETEAKTIQAWSEKMASFDGYVFITAEYNHSIPGAFKNASDYLQAELHNKAIGFIGYGGLGGARAIEIHRIIAAEQQLASVRKNVNFSLMTDFVNMSEFTPADFHLGEADEMFGQLLLWSKALKAVR